MIPVTTAHELCGSAGSQLPGSSDQTRTSKERCRKRVEERGTIDGPEEDKRETVQLTYGSRLPVCVCVCLCAFLLSDNNQRSNGLHPGRQSEPAMRDLESKQPKNNDALLSFVGGGQGVFFCLKLVNAGLGAHM